MARSGKKVNGTDVELQDKQLNFCIYYARSFNATKAYMEAYGVKYETAVVNGSRLLANANIRKTIDEIKSARMSVNMLKMDDIVQGFMDIAFSKDESAKDRMKAMEWLSSNMGLASEEQKARIAKLKAETKRIEDGKDDNVPQINIVMSKDVSEYAE